MQTIILETKIAAPIERCFLLSLSVDLHKASTANTKEEIIDGVSNGIMKHNETVTWRAQHFGLMLTHATLISKYRRPTYFQDVMTKGMFKSFEHDHHFTSLADNTTLMRDELRFAAPLSVPGWIAEKLVLQRYLRHFLEERNSVIKQVAESPDVWRQFMHAD